ncbi:MAG: glycosyltransferase family 4 protein [Paludibacteraceae bacterium]|nr:glycosyltransferase family 4 protein [Paludibacteraceae bacterium]HPH62569.1 glycosyltransferase family 1 protein [Paludibacteraceae bacterium]
MKRVLIDLSILKHINCGLGQVAYNYGCYFGSETPSDLDIYLLLPRQYFGAFGDKVHYVESKKIYRILPFLLPKYDLWHSIHQLSHYRPGYSGTLNLLTIHDLNFIHEKTGEKVLKYLKKLEKKVKRADKITSISNYAKKDILQNMNLEKEIEVIYNGVEKMSPVGEQKPSFAVDDQKPFLFSIGQIKAKKNFHVLLDAMKRMPEYNLYIAGQKETSYGELIEKRIVEEDIKNVFLVGEIVHAEKLWYYHHCSAFVFPSLLEGFGLPVIEALFFEKPVISSKETSLKEIGGDAVFFLDNFEPEHICNVVKESIDYFYAHPEMAQKNLAYANSFSYKKHMERYLSIYREMLK